jgi:hypothetical protein
MFASLSVLYALISSILFTANFSFTYHKAHVFKLYLSQTNVKQQQQQHQNQQKEPRKIKKLS